MKQLLKVVVDPDEELSDALELVAKKLSTHVTYNLDG